MIWDELRDWPGRVEVNGRQYDSVSDAHTSAPGALGAFCTIYLHSENERAPERKFETPASSLESAFVVTVRQYMTRHATSDFPFMKTWNNDIPMPLRTMVGVKVKETNGMVYMKLHGDIVQEQCECCMRCGKMITNPVSRYFGLGPECGGHNYINPFRTDEELRRAVTKYRKEVLQSIVWEGWIIKSAIISLEELK